MEPTPEQLKQLTYIRKEFGNAVEKSYRMVKATGVMRVRLRAQAGVWNWSFDRDGNMIHASMDMQLFEGDGNDPTTGPATQPNHTKIYDQT